jgi:hypothetical protein
MEKRFSRPAQDYASKAINPVLCGLKANEKRAKT